MAPTIARYSPSLLPSAWLRWAIGSPGGAQHARAENLRLLSGGTRREALELGNGRQALLLWLECVRRGRGAGDVLLPVQICSVVLECIRRAGLEPRFLDADGVFATPAPDQYAAAINAKTRAILIAPLYGYLQHGWTEVLDLGIPVAVDLAQGIGLLDVLDVDLLRRSEAMIYSFGLGKGIDAGGGLLLTRQRPILPIPRAGAATHLGALARAITLRGAEATGTYGFLVGQLEAASEATKEQEASFAPRIDTPQVHLLWRPKIRRFLEEINVARKRAAVLRSLAGVTPTIEALTAPDAAPLRQIIRVADSRRRNRAIAVLRSRGVDCAPAGESLPHDAEKLYPNAFAYGNDAIRLPFLGRLSSRAFSLFWRALESTFVDLSH